MSKYFSLVCNVTYLNFLQSILNALIRAGVAIIIRRNTVVWGVSFQTSGLEEGISIPIFLGRKIYENSYFSFSSPFTLQGRREWHMIGKKWKGLGKDGFFLLFFKSSLLPGFIHFLCPRASLLHEGKKTGTPEYWTNLAFREKELGSPHRHWPK